MSQFLVWTEDELGVSMNLLLGLILTAFVSAPSVFASYAEGEHCERVYRKLPETDPRRALIQATSVFGEIGPSQKLDQRIQINNGNISHYSKYIGMKNRPKGEKERLQSTVKYLENENRALENFYKPLFDRMFSKRSKYPIPNEFWDNEQLFMMKLVQRMFSYSDRLCKNGQLVSEETLKIQIEQDLTAFFDSMDTEVETRKKNFRQRMLENNAAESTIQSMIDQRDRKARDNTSFWFDNFRKSETLDFFDQVMSQLPVVRVEGSHSLIPNNKKAE